MGVSRFRGKKRDILAQSGSTPDQSCWYLTWLTWLWLAWIVRKLNFVACLTENREAINVMICLTNSTYGILYFEIS